MTPGIRYPFLVATLLLAGCADSPSGASARKPAQSGIEGSATLREGREIFYRTCTACHSADPVSAYSLEEWTNIVNDMAPRAKLDETRKAALMAYITAASSGLAN